MRRYFLLTLVLIVAAVVALFMHFRNEGPFVKVLVARKALNKIVDNIDDSTFEVQLIRLKKAPAHYVPAEHANDLPAKLLWTDMAPGAVLREENIVRFITLDAFIRSEDDFEMPVDVVQSVNGKEHVIVKDAFLVCYALTPVSPDTKNTVTLNINTESDLNVLRDVHSEASASDLILVSPTRH